MTPDDELAFIGEPPLFLPDADEVHVSCTFSWDKAAAERLCEAWQAHYPKVLLGGPAFGSIGDFVPGMYVKRGIVFTSRGCPNRCAFCVVPSREGELRELPIRDGWRVQDNNILACRIGHFEAVCGMLNRQRHAASFSGGLEARRLTGRHVEMLRSLRSIPELWFAFDSRNHLRWLRRAAQMVSWLPIRKRRCYVLCGFMSDTVRAASARLDEIFAVGFLPFPQLYQPPDAAVRREYGREWRALVRKWSRPAAVFARKPNER